MIKRRFWLVVMFHSFLLMSVFFALFQLPYTYDNESQVISWVSLFKNVLLGMEDKPDRDRFLLVNIAYEKQLVPKLDDYGFEIGNEAITDRAGLSEFYIKAANARPRLIFCDVFLDTSTDFDSVLASAIVKNQNVLFPYHFVDGLPKKPVIEVPSALSDYNSDFGNFIKYTFVQRDSCTSVALAMHKRIDGHAYDASMLFAVDEGVPVLNSLIIDLPIRQYDIFREDTLGYTSVHLQNLLELPPSLFNELLKDRIVVIGDFLENDLHDTIYGSMAGPLIHLNAYLSLERHSGVISIPFLIYLLCGCILLSTMLFGREIKTSIRWIERLEESKMGWLLDYLKYASVLLVISVGSYLLFGIYLNILLVSLYFSLVENIKEFFVNQFQLT